MNIKLTAFRESHPGGVFSRFMIMLPNAIGYDVDNLYFNPMDYPLNPFGWVFNQRDGDSYMNIECVNNGTYAKEGMGIGAIEDAGQFDELRSLCKKIKIQGEISDIVDAMPIKDGCLGVHVRTGDMNTTHPEYGVYTTQDFIDKILDLKPFQIFLASDNHLSIKKIRESIDCDILFIDGLMRERGDDFNTPSLYYKHMLTKRYWQEAFMDCLSLSRCSELLCRVSNLPNAAQLFSSTIKKVHRL
jgi:hypothetical protein